MKRFGSKVNNFWEPGYEPESDKTAFKPKDVDKVRDPVTNSVLKLKKLVKVKFIPIDDTISDTKRQAAKARWKVRNPTCIKFQIFFIVSNIWRCFDQ